MKSVRVLALAAIAACASVSGVASAASAENGKTAWMKNGCWQCHGTVGQGSTAASQGKVLTATEMPYDAFSAFVRNTRGAMPPFGAEIVAESDLQDIHAYLKSLPKPVDYKTIPLLNR